MCKFDDEKNALPGWQLALIGAEVDTLAFAPTAATQSMTAVPAGDYVLKAEGTYNYGNGNRNADARFSERKPGEANYGGTFSPWALSTSVQQGLSVRVAGNSSLWGDVFSPSHVYYGAFNQATAGDIDFSMYDTNYDDNTGSIDITLYEGYTGITEQNGCVTFKNVPYGDYQLEELMQTGWTNVAGLGAVTVDSDDVTFTVQNTDVVPVEQCTILSNTGTLVDTNETAVLTYEHKNWTNDIADAVWVWSTNEVTTPSEAETRIFSETFTVDNPTSAVLQVAADNLLLVRVNGEVVLDQTDQNNFIAPQTVDILPSLTATDGEYTIEFEVTNSAGENDYRRNPAGVLYRIDIESPVACVVTTMPEPKPELPPVTSCTYVSDLAINTAVSQENVAGNLTSFTLNGNSYSTGDEFDLFVTGDTTAAAGMYQDEVVMERTNDGLRVFFYGTGNSGPVTEFSGSFKLNGVNLTNVVIEADSEPNEANGAWPDAFALNQSTGEVTFSLYTYSSNDSFVIKGLEESCDPDSDDEARMDIFDGYKYKVDDAGTETPAAGWTITATNGDYSTTTVTDNDGQYEFYLAAGDWTITEEDRNDWSQVKVVQDGETLVDSTGMEFCFFDYNQEDDFYFEITTQSDESESSESDRKGLNCDFYNKMDVEDGGITPDTTPADEDIQRTSSRSSQSGQRFPDRFGFATPAATPQVLGATTANFCPFLEDFMQMGESNDSMEVMKLQIFLNIFKGMFGGTENPVTGTFGTTTDANVKAFQQQFQTEILDPWYNQSIVPHNRPTGFVYKTTLWKINSIVCPDYAGQLSFEGEDLTKNVNTSQDF